MKWKSLVPVIIVGLGLLAILGAIWLFIDEPEISTPTKELSDMDIISPYIIGSHEGCIQIAINSSNYYTGDKGGCVGFAYPFLSIEVLADKIRRPDDH